MTEPTYEYRVAWDGKYPGASVTCGDRGLAERMFRYIRSNDKKPQPRIQRRLVTLWEDCDE